MNGSKITTELSTDNNTENNTEITHKNGKDVETVDNLYVI